MSPPTVNAFAAVMLYAVGVLTGVYVGYWIGRAVESSRRTGGKR